MGSAQRLRIACLIVVALLLGLGAPAVLPVASLLPAASAAPDGWDPTLPQVASAGAPGDPLAIANMSLQASAAAAQTTLDLGRKFLGSLGIIEQPSAATAAAPGGRVRGQQAVEYVIQRAGSQMGLPYSWGGGSLTGPSTGVDSGAGTVGFDCSGLTRYAFAGVGVLIPRFSGDQFNAGRKVSPAEAKRGDLLFWGPGGSQHVAIYLGGGRMLEASGSAGKVTVSAVRSAGLTSQITRIIEY